MPKGSLFFDPSGRPPAFLGAAFAAASTAAGGLLAARPLIARLYSHDADVVELTGRCVPALALLVFFDAQNVCIQGTLSGAGAPQRIAMSNLIGWYVVGAPTALGLLFGLDLDAGAAPVLAKLLTDPEIEDAGARKHAAALLKSMAAADARGVAAALQCDADRVVIGLEIDQRLATKPVDTMRRSTSQKTLAAMMRRLTPKSSSSKKNVVTK